MDIQRKTTSVTTVVDGMGIAAKKKAAVFVDFDNLHIGLAQKDPRQAEFFATSPVVWLQRLMGDERKILRRRCYLNPNVSRKYRQQFISAGFDVVDCPALTTQGKNAADIRMAMDIQDSLNHPSRFDEFILLSADSDFTPVLMRLREHDRETCIVHSDPLSQAYRASADRVLDFQALYDEEYVGGTEDIQSGARIEDAPGRQIVPSLLALTPHDPVTNPCPKDTHELPEVAQDEPGMRTGTIYSFFPEKGYGFVQPSGTTRRDDNCFFHVSHLKDVEQADLIPGAPVQFYAAKSSDGNPVAWALSLIR